MITEKAEHYCPCGKLWPCRCAKAWRVMGFLRPPDIADDSNIVATVECPRCNQTVLLEIEPASIDGASKENKPGAKWIVDSAGGPPIGECCDLLFCVQPDGEVESFRIPASRTQP